MKYKNLLIIAIIVIIILCMYNLKSLKIHNDIKPLKITTNQIKENINKVKMTIVGDFLFEEPYYNALSSGEDENKYFSLVKNIFLNDDLSIGNMEVVIGNNNLNVSGVGYEFCAPESVGKQISQIGLDVLSTANNHSYDRGIDGVRSTIEFFKNNTKILTVGTNLEKKKDNKILNINNIRFGFLSYASGTNKQIKNEDLYSINLYRDPTTNTITDEYKNKIKEEVNNLKGKVDVIIVILHWGTEFTFDPTDEQKSLALYLNELGVNIVIGSHSHCMQPIEWIKSGKQDTLVYYSMGNFVSADEDISRTGETFDNAYQVGLLSNIIIEKINNNIFIKNVNVEPVINYYDDDFRNFLLIPYSKYTEEYEKTHFRYKYNFNKSFIDDMYNKVIDEEFKM